MLGQILLCKILANKSQVPCAMQDCYWDTEELHLSVYSITMVDKSIVCCETKEGLSIFHHSSCSSTTNCTKVSNDIPDPNDLSARSQV